MDQATIKDFVLRALRQASPGAAVENLDPDKRFRDQFEFDSVDFLNFALSLQEGLKIVIPEEDFPSLATMNGCLGYLLSKGDRLTTPKTL